jgi:hypothetical protein
MIDVWPLGDTWALRQFRIGSGDFESLTRTTFLNVEGVIVDLSAPQRGRRRVYASGFFEALQTRVLDINLEENPYPELSAIHPCNSGKARIQPKQTLGRVRRLPNR